MANTSANLVDFPMAQGVSAESTLARNRRTIQAMVDGFAGQDIDSIMAQFSDDAVYCDILGKGTRGDEYHGKDAIRESFVRQFDMTGSHTFIDAKIMVEDGASFARWTLVVGDPADRKAPRFEGIDEFAFNAAGEITLKKAWIKGQPRLRRALLAHNPMGVFRHLGYSLRSWGR